MHQGKKCKKINIAAKNYLVFICKTQLKCVFLFVNVFRVHIARLTQLAFDVSFSFCCIMTSNVFFTPENCCLFVFSKSLHLILYSV